MIKILPVVDQILFYSLNTNIVSLTGTNTAFVTGSGDSFIQVTLPDDGNYNKPTFSLEVSKGDPIISHGDLSKNYGESFINYFDSDQM